MTLWKPVVGAVLQAWLLPGCCVCAQLGESLDFNQQCSDCRQAWPSLAGQQPPLNMKSRTALWLYSGSVRRLLVQSKDMPRSAQAWALLSLIQAGLPALDLPSQAIWTTPPPSRKRRWSDWYLPHFLATRICKQAGYRYRSLLNRQHETRDQADLDGAARRSNLQHAFAPKWSWRHESVPKKVILFDDVSTTGATLSEAARALHLHGVEEVHGLSVAVVP